MSQKPNHKVANFKINHFVFLSNQQNYRQIDINWSLKIIFFFDNNINNLYNKTWVQTCFNDFVYFNMELVHVKVGRVMVLFWFNHI